MSESQYQAGVCNIGGAEVTRRKQVSYFGGAIYLVLLILSLVSTSSSALRLPVFISALIFAIGYIQSRKKFCLAFGLMGTFNFSELGKLSKVVSPEALAADRKLAVLIIGQALALATLLTVPVFFI